MFLGLLVSASAAELIDWFTLDAAGGAQSSGSYVVNSTLGQGEVGNAPISSASYRIVPGFWAIETVGPATGLPLLSIALSGPNVVVSWPSFAAGFGLQESDSLDSVPVAWANSPAAVSDNGFVRSVTVPHHLARRFYRLRRN